VTLTMEDAELAEAARFVLESAAETPAEPHDLTQSSQRREHGGHREE